MNNDLHKPNNGENNEGINKNTEDTENGRHTDTVDSIQGKEEAFENSGKIEEGVSKKEETASVQGDTDRSQGTDAGQKIPSAEEKEEAAHRQASQNIEKESRQGSYTYTPRPETEAKKESGKKKKCSIGMGIIAVIVAIAILVTAIGGTVGMLFVGGMTWFIDAAKDMFSFQIESNNGGSSDADQPASELPSMNIIKNDQGIDLNVQTGSTGYPEDMSIPEVVEKVQDTVVEIITQNVVTDMFYNQYVKSGAGSGVIITTDGYIVTNYHVIDGARSATVRLTDGSEFSASFVGADPEKDVALIKINATGLTAAVMGSSKALVVGQDVIAIGNPLGTLGGTVTNGIISALDRTVVVDGNQMTLMQTNAAINPGNSGGGLFNRAGELIGIVNAKQADTGIEGLGFAIPIDVVFACIEEITKAG